MSGCPRAFATFSLHRDAFRRVSQRVLPVFSALLFVALFSAMHCSTVQATAVTVQIGTVDVSSSLGSASYPILVTPTGNGKYQYLSGPEEIQIFSNDANHNLLATIEPFGLSLSLDPDPMAGLSFGVLAGNAPTNFTISTAPVVFAALSNPLAFASASVTVTDFDNDGASLTGAYAGQSFKALSNIGVFTTLAPSLVAVGAGSNASTPNVPPTVGNILGAVTTLQASFSFQLSANDLGSGSGTFSVPEPGTFVLLALAGLCLLGYSRRRR